MGVTFKVEAADGTLGESVKAGCWGNFKMSATLEQLIVNDKQQRSRVAWRQDMAQQERYTWMDGAGDSTYTQWLKTCRTTLNGAYGLTSKQASGGFKAVHHITHHMDYHGELKMEALEVTMKAYPKLFTGVTIVDKDEGRVRVSCDEHYAIVYNQLRFLEGLGYIGQHTSTYGLRAAIDNPALSFPILDIYWGDTLRIGEKTLFKMQGTGRTRMAKFIERRDWYIGELERNNPEYNMIVKGNCHKHESSAFSNIMYDGTGEDYQSDYDEDAEYGDEDIANAFMLPSEVYSFINYMNKGVA